MAFYSSLCELVEGQNPELNLCERPHGVSSEGRTIPNRCEPPIHKGIKVCMVYTCVPGGSAAANLLDHSSVVYEKKVV